MDFSPFAVGGAATRSDSFTKLRPEFASGVYRMVQDARAAGVPLEITSAYRSPDLQAQLFDDAVAKYGSPEAARKFVAPAGRSQHNFGTAVDFAVNGQLIRDPQSAEAKWIRENAAKYGLAVPMDWEPWQVELKGARAQTLGKGGSMLKPTGATPQMDKEEDKTDFRDIAGNLAIAFNSLRHRPDPNVAATVQNIQQQRTAKAAKNKSIEMLRGAGRDDIADAIESGALGAKEGVSLMFREAAELRKRQTDMADAMTLAEFEAGLKVPTVSAGEQKIARLMETGIPRETAIAIADGRITSSRDPQTGRVVLLDKGTGQVIGQAPEGSEQVIVEQSQPSDMFEGLDIRKGTGARGWANKYINLVSDAVFGGQYASEAGEVREAMNVLGLETLALADTSFAGKPTNFLRERVEEAIVIKPAEISTGPDRAQKKQKPQSVYLNAHLKVLNAHWKAKHQLWKSVRVLQPRYLRSEVCLTIMIH